MSIYEELISNLAGFYETFTNVLVKTLVYGIPIAIIGYVFGRIVRIVINVLFKNILGIDAWIERKGFKEFLIGIRASKLVADIVVYYIYLYTTLLFFKVLGVEDLIKAFEFILGIYPRFVGFLIMVMVGLATSEIIKRNILESESSFTFKKELAIVAKYSILYVFFVIALDILKVIPTDIFYSIFKVVLYTIAGISVIALGLGIGLALKEELRPYIREYLQRKFKK
jgi:hypothetical protein